MHSTDCKLTQGFQSLLPELRISVDLQQLLRPQRHVECNIGMRAAHAHEQAFA